MHDYANPKLRAVDNARKSQALRPIGPQAAERTLTLVPFEVTLSDESVECVEGADSYQQEGPMTTFFGNEARRGTLDCWSVKVASYRTDRILRIRRHDPVGLSLRAG